MKKITKILCLILCISFLFSGCGTKDTNQPKEQKEEKEINEKYHTCEFRYGKYQRTISFDQPIKASEAKAEYKNGVLCVKIPKQDTETAKGKKLEIN